MCIVQTRIFIIFLSATERIKDQTLLRYSWKVLIMLFTWKKEWIWVNVHHVCILYIKQIQQHTRKQPASLFCLNLQQQTNLYLTTSSTPPHTPLFQKKEEKKMVINRVLDLIWRVLLVLVLWKFCQNNSLFVETYIPLFLFKTPA